MPHCMVIIFADAKNKPYHTDWLEEQRDALDQVTVELAKGRVAWIGWSYCCDHYVDDKIIERKLTDMARSQIKSYRNTYSNRSPIKQGLNLVVGLADKFRYPVQVLHQQKANNAGYGFAYAPCTRSVALADSDSKQRGSNA